MHSETALESAIRCNLGELLNDEQPEFLLRLRELFHEETVRQLAEMERAALAREAEPLRRAAHALKGSCGNIGAVEMAGLCRQIERHADGGEFEAVHLLLPQLAEQGECATQALDAVLNSRATDVG